MTPVDTPFNRARKAATEAGRQIVNEFGQLDRRERVGIIRVFRSQLIPPRKPGRRPSKEVTAAHEDWQAGMRGTELYRKHIPGFDRMNRYRRNAMIRALLDAIRSRERRKNRGKTVDLVSRD